MYKILYARRVFKDIEKISDLEAEKIQKLVNSLVSNSRPFGCQKLQGYCDRYRLKVGTYRIVYSIDDKMKIIRIHIISHRKDVYRHIQ